MAMHHFRELKHSHSELREILTTCVHIAIRASERLFKQGDYDDAAEALSEIKGLIQGVCMNTSFVINVQQTLSLCKSYITCLCRRRRESQIKIVGGKYYICCVLWA
jgi:hypothetical protein